MAPRNASRSARGRRRAGETLAAEPRATPRKAKDDLREHFGSRRNLSGMTGIA